MLAAAPRVQVQPLAIRRLEHWQQSEPGSFFISRCQRGYLFNEPAEWKRETERCERSCRVPVLWETSLNHGTINQSGPSPTYH